VDGLGLLNRRNGSGEASITLGVRLSMRGMRSIAGSGSPGPVTYPVTYQDAEHEIVAQMYSPSAITSRTPCRAWQANGPIPWQSWWHRHSVRQAVLVEIGRPRPHHQHKRSICIAWQFSC
jgi:hypothetical protein